MEFNITDIALKTNAENIVQCHNITAIPAVIIVAMSFIVFFLIFGLSLVREDRKRLMSILGLTFLFAGSITLAVIFLPNFVQSIWNFLF